MENELDSKFQKRGKQFSVVFDQEDLQSKRVDQQAELRRAKRSNEAFKKRKLKEFEIEWIDIEKSPNQRYSIEELDDLINSLINTNKRIVLMGIYGIRKLLSQSMDFPIENIMNSKAVSYIIQCLYFQDCPQIQYEAAWALTNMCTSSHDHIRTIIEKGCLKGLGHMMSSTISEVKEQAIWAIGNISADSAEYRNLIVENSLLVPLVNIVLNSQINSLTKQGCWTLSNICRAKPTPSHDIMKPVLPALAKGVFLHQEMREVLSDILWGLCCLTEARHNAIDDLVDSDILPLIVSFAQSKNFAIILPAIKILGNVIGGTDKQADIVIKVGGIIPLVHMLKVQYTPIKREAVWALSNLCAGSMSQLKEIFKYESFEVQKEIAWSFSNIISNDIDYIDELIDSGLINVVVLFFDNKDSSIVLASLMMADKIFEHFFIEREGLGKFLQKFEEIDGFKALESLQKSKNPKIYAKAIKIIEKYFDE